MPHKLFQSTGYGAGKPFSEGKRTSHYPPTGHAGWSPDAFFFKVSRESFFAIPASPVEEPAGHTH